MAAAAIPTSALTTELPSFFEVYASQHLNAALRPAVRFVLDVLALRHRRIRQASNCSDELFTLILFVVEGTQLSRHSSLLSESFYGLQRMSLTPSRSFGAVSVSRNRLSRVQIAVALLLDVVCPYLRAKLDAIHSRITGGAAAPLFENDVGDDSGENSIVSVATDPVGSGPRQDVFANDRLAPRSRTDFSHVLRSLIILLARAIAKVQLHRRNLIPTFVQWYPKLRAAIDGANIIISLFYLYGYSRHFSLSLFLQQLVLRRSSHLDVLRFAIANRFRPPAVHNTFAIIVDAALTALKSVFIACIFMFRFLQYYYAAEASAPREVGPALAPPERLHPAQGVDEQVALAPGMCPLCLQNRLTSGYVFCYLCIVAHIQQAGKCPVTFAPTTVSDLIRIYEEDSAM